MICNLIRKFFQGKSESEVEQTPYNLFNFFLPSGFKVRVYYEDWYNESFDYLLMPGSGVELELLYNDVLLNTAFKLRNSPTRFNSAEVESPYIFGIGSLEVVKEYRNRGVATILICEALITILKHCKERNIIVYLVNTSQTIIDSSDAIQYKIYDSIFNLVDEKDKRMQYRVFRLEDREDDIASITKLLKFKFANFSTEN